MPSRLPLLARSFCPRGLIIIGLAGAVGALAIGCDYQLQVQPTGTATAAPSGALHVRQVPGQATPAAAEGTPAAASIAALVQQYLSGNGAGANPTAGAAPAAATDTQNAPAAAPPPAAAAPVVAAPAAMARRR